MVSRRSTPAKARMTCNPLARDVMKSGSPPRYSTLSGSVALITRWAINEPDVLGNALDCNIARSYRYCDGYGNRTLARGACHRIICDPGARPDAGFEA